jgi:PAB-dependent poly(A)-specific ribonuclease subunit 3
VDLSREVENGRLFRIVSKLGMINERPEFDMDASWSETGDRYLLKLFRDYVFHQVYEDGSPVLDLGHVVECLTKVPFRVGLAFLLFLQLDLGVDEKIVLMSRDEQSIIIVSYRDLKRCMEQSLMDLAKKKMHHPPHHVHGAFYPPKPSHG